MVDKLAPAAAGKSQSQTVAAVYPFFVAAAKQFRYGIPPFESWKSSEKRPEALAQATEWMEQIDKKIAAHELRKLLHSSSFSGDDTAHALILRYLNKAQKTGADRDKLDYLLAHYLRLHGDAEMQRGELDLERAGQLLEPVLGKVSGDGAQWLEPLDVVINDLNRCASLRDLDGWEIIQRGRNIQVEGREQ